MIADDPSYKMTLGTKVRTFTNMTLLRDRRARSRGETGCRSTRTRPTDASYEYLMQADTDFGFLNEMADRAGYDWWVDATGR